MLPMCPEIVRQPEKHLLPSISAALGRTDYPTCCSMLGLWLILVSSPLWGFLLVFGRLSLSVWPLKLGSSLSFLGLVQ